MSVKVEILESSRDKWSRIESSNQRLDFIVVVSAREHLFGLVGIGTVAADHNSNILTVSCLLICCGLAPGWSRKTRIGIDFR